LGGFEEKDNEQLEEQLAKLEKINKRPSVAVGWIDGYCYSSLISSLNIQTHQVPTAFAYYPYKQMY
jgi:hypothetical protein